MNRNPQTISGAPCAILERSTFADPQTGRTWTQLTHGPDAWYPLYYYGPSVTIDGERLLLYRYGEGVVQNWMLDLVTGQATCLTNAATPDCLWRFWDEPETARGVREQMSAFSPESEEMVYWDGHVLRAVHVRTLADRVVFELPPDREPCCVPGLSPCGRHFVFAHADRAWWAQATRPGPPRVYDARNVRLDVVDVRTGACRTLLAMHAWLTHAHFLDDQRILFTHAGNLLMTDLRGGWYVGLRPLTAEGIRINHAVPTRRGIQYETVSPMPHGIMGRCNPDTYRAVDYYCNFPIHHVGRDPDGRFWFGDCYEPHPPHARFLAWLPRVQSGTVNSVEPLTHGFHLYGRPACQRNHIHAALMPDRRQILFTGPDQQGGNNQVFLLDISDLADSETEVCP